MTVKRPSAYATPEAARIGTLISAAALSVMGTFLHFAYAISGNSSIVALIAPVNESVWEHLKLLFFPAMLMLVIEYFIYGRKIPNFVSSRIISVICGMAAIVILFYTYSGILGYNVPAVDIALFFVGVAVNAAVSYLVISSGVYSTHGWKLFFIALACAIAAMFIVFTFFTPEIGIFRDPVNGTYGI